MVTKSLKIHGSKQKRIQFTVGKMVVENRDDDIIKREDDRPEIDKMVK